jgi:predicted PurR-regulated permease PerM
MNIGWLFGPYVGTGLTALCLVVVFVLAVLLMNNWFSGQVRGWFKYLYRSLQKTIDEVLAAYAQTDDQIMEWGEDVVAEMRAKARSLLDKQEELYSSTRKKVEGFLVRLDHLRGGE